MSNRSRWKVPFIAPLFLIKSFCSKKKAIQIYNRNSIIPSCFVDKSYYLYNGRLHWPMYVTSNMKGFKFGEFSITKYLGYRGIKKKKNKKINQRF